MADVSLEDLREGPVTNATLTKDGIRLRDCATDRDVRHRIVTALHHSADVDARHIAVTVSGNTATLTGTVGTWLQRDAAERAAADAPGIADVDNRIVVQSFHDSTMDDWDEAC